MSSSHVWRPYLGVTFVIAGLTALLYVFGSLFGLVNIALFYLFPVLFSAIYWGLGPSVYAAGAGVVALDFLFVPPLFSFTIDDLRYLISFVVYVAVAVWTSRLAARLKQQLALSKRREAQTTSLYAISRQMTATPDLDALLSRICLQVTGMLNRETVIFLPEPERQEELEWSVHAFGSPSWGRGETERSIAKWVFEQGVTAGRGTGTLRETTGLYIPLRTEERIYGVLAVNFEQAAEADHEAGSVTVTQETLELLEAVGGLVASAIARIKLGEEAKLAHLSAESERLRTALLDSVSHELRTPLAAINGAVGSLIDGDSMFSREDRLELLSTVREGALRMNRLVINLLGMVQLESGMLRLRRTWCDIEDVLGVVLAQVKEDQQHRTVRVEVPEESGFFLGDDTLIEQVLVNVISNAIKYSPDHSEIVITVKRLRDTLDIRVADTGAGIAASDRERIFEKFYRSKATRHIPGTGLGLAICKGIMEAHGGTIAALPNGDKGTVIRLTLPAGEPDFVDRLKREGEDEEA